MSSNKPMIFTAPILIAPFDSNSGFIEGCSGGNKAPITGCDIQQPGGGGCDTGLAVGATVIGAVVGGIFTVAIAS